MLWICKGEWNGKCVLGDKNVKGISTHLTSLDAAIGKPFRLHKNSGNVFRGTEVRGTGFILTEEEAQSLLRNNPRNRDVILGYLSGNDLNSTPDQSPTRWIINFHEWTFDHASQYPECLAILTEKVKPYRNTITKQIHEPDYWKFWDKRLAEYVRMAEMPRVLVTAKVSPTNAVAWVKPGIVFHEKVVIFPFAEGCHYAVMQSSLHWEWVRYFTSTLGATTLNYSPSDCFETFPFPDGYNTLLNGIADAYDNLRRRIMLEQKIGLTKTYNRFHDSDKISADIQKLRDLHVEMDKAVAIAYGWNDVDLGHGFHETKQGIRYTISEPACREVLQRLLKLNHERYAEEVKQGLYDKKKRASGTRKNKKATGTPLFK